MKVILHRVYEMDDTTTPVSGVELYNQVKAVPRTRGGDSAAKLTTYQQRYCSPHTRG